MRTIPELQEGTHRAKATGTLPNGKPVVVNSDGTVSVAASSTFSEALGSASVFESATVANLQAAFDTVNNKLLIVYGDDGNSNYGTAIVGTVDTSDNSISFGTAVVFNSASTTNIDVAFSPDNGKFLIVYEDSAGKAIVGTVSSTSVSFGSETTFANVNVRDTRVAYNEASGGVGFFVIAYRDDTNSNHGKAVVVSILVNGSPNVYTPATFNSGETSQISLAYDSANQKTVIAYKDDANSNVGTAIVATRSTGSLSFGSEVVFNNAATQFTATVYDSTNEKIVIGYQDLGDSSKGTAVVGTVSGTAISFGSEVVFNTGSTQKITGDFDIDGGKVIFGYADTGNSNYGTFVVGTVSGTSISFGSEVVFEAAAVSTHDVITTYCSTIGKIVFSYRDNGNSNYGTAIVLQNAYTFSNLTSENYIGMSQGVAELENVGSPVTFESGATSYSVNTYDSNADRMVVAYSDAGDSGKGKVAVGTVSGDTTSFGTPVAFTSYQIQQARIVFDSNSNKIVIAWIKSSDNAGMSIVGTVDPSDNSISFGSEVQFEAGLAHMSLGFDSTNNKIISAFADLSDNNHGYAIVGTVSGTSISFGSISKFEAENTRHTDIAHDPDAGKTVIAYMDQGNSSYGTAVVSTVSGTSISFGTPVVYESASTTDNSVVYDTNSNKMVIAYSDGGNSSYGTAVVGTVSGTSISFGTPVVFHAAGYILQPICTFDAGSNKVVIVYMDSANDGRYVVGAVSGTSISFEASSLVESNATFSDESFWISNIGSNKNSIVYRDNASSNIGRAVVLSLEQRGQVASGSSATVDIIGSLSTNQGGLTAGQSYYVQTDGTIGETPADPSVFAGTAISATSLVVKT